MKANSALRRICVVISLIALGSCGRDQHESALRERRAAILRQVFTEFHSQSRFPGGVIGAWFRDGTIVVVATGVADRTTNTPMPDSALLHAGSIGKTLYAAWILQLVGEGRLRLDDSVARYLGTEPWYSSIPNASAITVRMLLNHTAGIPVFGDAFMRALVADPGRPRAPLEAVRSVAGANAVAPPGAEFAYSDVNYQPLHLLGERLTGQPAAVDIQHRLLQPHTLARIVPADRKQIPGLVQGYAGEGFFLGFDSVLSDGQLILDPTFEGGGGGFVTNAGDVAKWMALFAEGRVFPAALLADVRRGVPAGQLDVGAQARSGLGVEIVETPLGTAYGHGGFFPGYLSLALWYPSAGVSLAVQVNSSASGALARPLRDVLLAAAQALRDDTTATAR
jgi:D-alanyl-D-alanine carboxypeptidase